MTTFAQRLSIAAALRLRLRSRARYDRLDPEARAAWRADRLERLRRHAVRRSPLYAERHGGVEAPLDSLPVLNKSDVVDHFDELVTDRDLTRAHLRNLVDAGEPPEGGRHRAAASSGSSGRPGLLAFDRDEWVDLLVAAARARAISGRPPVEGRPRTARIGSPSRWHLSRQLPETLHDPRRPSLTLSAASSEAELVDALHGFRPDVLSGYPSALVALADAQVAGRLAIGPSQVFTGGERLAPRARDVIRSAWGVEPFDQYLTTEAGFVAIECPAHDGLHVLDDHVVVELVDADGRPVPPGVDSARVLLTVLGSRTVPLIRYELGDVASWAEGPCGCGRPGPRLGAIATGERQLLRLPTASGGDVLVHPVAVTAVLDPAPVAGYQVVHEGRRVRALIASPPAGFETGELARRLESALDRCGAAVHVEVVVVETLPRSPSGKAAMVVSAPPEAGTATP